MKSKIASRIRMMTESLRQAGHTVNSAIEREEWGKNLMSPTECTPLDFMSVKAADHLIAILDRTVSEGVLVELGWASAWGINMTIIIDEALLLSPLVAGLPTISETHIYPVKWNDPQHVWMIPLQVRGLL